MCLCAYAALLLVAKSMALSIAHGCFGLALGIWRVVPRCGSWREALQLAWERRRELLVCILIANAPDIDFFFGILTGNLNRFHQAGTHTLAGILAMALGLWLYGKYALKNRPVLAFWFVFLLLAGHLVIDVFTADTRRPIGIMLAWPFSERYWHSAVSLFPAAAKQNAMDIFCLRNLKNAGWEFFVSFPFVAAALLMKIHKQGLSLGGAGLPPGRSERDEVVPSPKIHPRD